MIDRRPAVIARCADTADVVASIQFASEHDLPVSVRGGGHNVSGSALLDGGFVIDLSDMRDVRVDTDTRRAVAQGGVTIGELDRATQKHGLATPMGVVTETGIAGLTLGGGMGWLRRKHGLCCDALRSVEIVTADGQTRRADATSQEDLFWAVRGGGGNFGVVTRFEYELYDVGPEVFFLLTIYPIEEAAHVLRDLSSFMSTAPDAISPLGFLAHAPALAEIPTAHHGQPCLFVVGPYAGDVQHGKEELDPVRRLGTPIADLSGPTTYLEVQQFFDEDYPSGARYYWKSVNLTELTDPAIETLIALNEDAPSPESTLDFWFQGGAMSRVGPEETAFGDRSSPLMIGIEANWHDEATDDANVAWARRCYDALQPFSDGTMYLNFPGFEEEDTKIRDTFGANYERLAAIKHAYDPGNLFRTHQNIPATASSP